MKTKQSGVSAGLIQSSINGKAAKKLLIALLGLSSLSFAGPCPGNVRDILKANHGQSITLSYSPDKEKAANACKDKITQMVQKKMGKEPDVKMVPLSADPKGQFTAS
ncbi:MAG: hypothetical protein K0R14_1125 [Burkholderiales bacterium]|nr:hypothetical protein [Burkholderiales bacterium]